MNLDTPIQYLKGVGPKLAIKLKKLGLEKVQDLLYYFPRAWQDFSHQQAIKSLRIGENAIIKAKIISISNNRTPRRRMTITSAIVEDSVSDTIKLVWFNQPFLLNNFRVGDEWIFYGRVEYDWQLKEKTIHSPIYEKKSQILPIYAETQGITTKYLRRLIQNVLTPLSLVDFLPEQIINSEKILTQEQAVKEVHFPLNNHLLNRAKYRLAFDEIFLIVLKMQLTRRQMQNQGAPVVNINKELLVKFTKSLPYQLTNAQRKASWEIIKDMNRPHPMNRLLDGDVGSGKTIVALMAALNCMNSNLQVVWMAPTEILANQHYETTCKLLKDFDIIITLVTSNKITSNQVRVMSKSKSLIANRSQLKSLTQFSELIIGTHSLIQEGVSFTNLGLVIIDEQHRFGVSQRAKLASGSTRITNPTRIDADNIIGANQRLSEDQCKSAEVVPHFLSMTATPIPRTLALSIYGDLDISVLDEMPLGRKPIITRLVEPTDRQKAYSFIKEQIKSGRQAFVICPLIETKSQITNHKSQTLFDLERKSVKVEYEKLSKQIFPDLRIGILHGKMKAKEKDQVMQDFNKREIDILVSTSVVEVGVDIPNATVMIIEDADRFGLAQLHQFRGRVGRGEYQSYCLLFTNSLSTETNNRLKALVDCTDGFKLAQCDLEIRGPGELVGSNQSGLADLKMASLTDIILIEKTKRLSQTIIDNGLEKYPLLKAKMHEFVSTKHLE